MVNHFSIMLQRRLKEQEHGEEEDEEGEKGAKKKKKKKKKGGQGGDLRIHDLDYDLELSSDNSESSAGEGMRDRTEKAAETGSFFYQYCIHIFIFFSLVIFLAFLELLFETLQMEKVRRVRRRPTLRLRGKRKRRRRAVMWKDMRTAMMETLKVWKWTTCLMRAGKCGANI